MFLVLWLVACGLEGQDPWLHPNLPAGYDALPWFAHPASATFLLVGPLVAVGLLLRGVWRAVRGRRQRSLLRDSGLAVSLLLFVPFGLVLGARRGRVPEGCPATLTMERALPAAPMPGVR